MDAYLYLLNKKSLDKLAVKDIIETADVNRNTFYYYFEDIYDLQHKVFQKKFEDFCEGISQQTSFYDEYVRAAEICFKQQKGYGTYLPLQRQRPDSDIHGTCYNQVRGRFRTKAAVSYNLSEQCIEYLTNFYSNAIVGNTMHWIKEGMRPTAKNISCLFQNLSKTLSTT